MLKIRLQGTPEEISCAQKRLESVFHILSVSEPYKDRGKTKYWRVYLDCELKGKNNELEKDTLH